MPKDDRPLPDVDRLKKIERAAFLRFRGLPHSQIAKELGVEEADVRRWEHDERFQAVVRREYTESAETRLHQAYWLRSRSMAGLGAIIADPNAHPAIKAKIMLDIALPDIIATREQEQQDWLGYYDEDAVTGSKEDPFLLEMGDHRDEKLDYVRAEVDEVPSDDDPVSEAKVIRLPAREA